MVETEHRMVSVLDELELTVLVTSITGLSAVGAAAILAETGDPKRFLTARALVKHAGLAPREKLSGNFTGRTKLTGKGRLGLRLAAWRAVWGAQRANAVHQARYRHLTTREHNKLTATQAQTVIAAAIVLLDRRITTLAEQHDAARALGGLCPGVVVVKGGHAVSGSEREAVDVLWDGSSTSDIRTPRVKRTRNDHGTGCTFSAAIAAGLARGLNRPAAVLARIHRRAW